MAMTYQPNFNDPRVITATKRAMGFVLGVLSETKAKPWSGRYINKYLGQQQNQLSRYFRDVLLITTNHRYNKDAKLCKQHIRNQLGVEFLRAKLTGSCDLNWNEFLEEHKKTTTILLYPSVLLLNDNPDKQRNYEIDKRLVKQLMKREFATELTNLQFSYKDKSNRLWHNLQNVRKEFKTEILAEAGLKYQYDISSCAPSLIMQYAQQIAQSNGSIDMDEWMPSINEYLHNKTSIREQIASELGIDIKTAKVIINALFCGARVGDNADYEISQLLRNNRQRIRLLQANEFVTKLRKEISKCWAVITTTMPRRYKQYPNGRTRLIAISSREKWSVYFELERSVLNAISDYLDQTDNKRFLEHDGWTSEHQVNEQELIDFVQKRTGYRIKLDRG